MTDTCDYEDMDAAWPLWVGLAAGAVLVWVERR